MSLAIGLRGQALKDHLPDRAGPPSLTSSTRTSRVAPRRVDFVMRERPRLGDGHGAVDVVPRDRRIRIVRYAVPVFGLERTAKRLARAAQYQTPEYALLAILSVAHLAPLRKDDRALLGG